MGNPEEGEGGVSSEGIENQSDASLKTTIHRLEMPEEMKNKALATMRKAMEDHKIEKDMATYMKRNFDETQGGTWHCIVGKGFGCSVAYDTQYLIFFQIGQVYALLFKSIE